MFESATCQIPNSGDKERLGYRSVQKACSAMVLQLDWQCRLTVCYVSNRKSARPEKFQENERSSIIFYSKMVSTEHKKEPQKFI